MGEVTLLHAAGAARDWCARVREEGATLGLVPTMGALHVGHLTLVERAVRENDFACVSVFVNPMQFGDPRDLELYPRDFEGDARLLAEVGCAMVFTDELQGFFPEVQGATPANIPRSDPGPAAEGLEGAYRLGHFDGVATIVARLFELTRANTAYFGEKDFQQTLVVSHVARALGYPDVRVVSTSRDADGLARSSRNALLAGDDRPRALSLSRALFAARDAYAAGERDPAALQAKLFEQLAEVEVDYAEVRDPDRWSAEAPAALPRAARALIAAKVGSVRLIDNISLSGGDAP